MDIKEIEKRKYKGYCVCFYAGNLYQGEYVADLSKTFLCKDDNGAINVQYIIDNPQITHIEIYRCGTDSKTKFNHNAIFTCDVNLVKVVAIGDLKKVKELSDEAKAHFNPNPNQIPAVTPETLVVETRKGNEYEPIVEEIFYGEDVLVEVLSEVDLKKLNVISFTGSSLDNIKNTEPVSVED